MIKLEQVSKSWDGGQSFTVSDVSFEVKTGEVVALLGGSGSGKSTVVKMINRLFEITSGSIEIDGTDVLEIEPVELRRRIGYVFQGIGLFPHLTIAENISIVWKIAPPLPHETRRSVEELLELVQLSPGLFKDRYPRQLSGGQRQRVGFARAIANNCRTMLLDEPFGALDPITRHDLQQEFIKIQSNLGLTAVLVTHDVTEALLLADQVAVMNEGALVQFGPVKEVLNAPKHPYVKHLFSTPIQQIKQLESLLRTA